MRRWILFVLIIFFLSIVGLIWFINIKVKKTSLEKPVFSYQSLLEQARQLEEKRDLLSAKSIYQRLINEFTDSGQLPLWQKKIEELNIKILFSPIVCPGSILYEIKSGDTLYKIAKEFNTTVDLIMQANNLKSERIYPGTRIKVYTQPFSIIIDKSENILILKSNEEIIKTYTVSTGENNSTPTGTFKIVNKLKNPTWYKAGAVVPPSSPENILGSRWLGFNLKGYGIHGTLEPQSLGRSVTQGCIRMSNPDVEELYTIVPLGTEVTIVD